MQTLVLKGNRLDRDAWFEKTIVICDRCGWYNQKHNVLHYGTCSKCKKELNNRSHFKNYLYQELKLWRKK